MNARSALYLQKLGSKPNLLPLTGLNPCLTPRHYLAGETTLIVRRKLTTCCPVSPAAF